jgi:hypothetical protein
MSGGTALLKPQNGCPPPAAVALAGISYCPSKCCIHCSHCIRCANDSAAFAAAQWIGRWWSWGILQPHRRRRAARGSGRCVSARTRERSRRPLPLQPAFACGEWLAGGGEWPGLGLGSCTRSCRCPCCPCSLCCSYCCCCRFEAIGCLCRFACWRMAKRLLLLPLL